MLSFMRSLRQYPTVTSSADFIQNLLDHSCNRRHSKRKSTFQHSKKTVKKQAKIPRKRLERSASFIGKIASSSQEELLNYTYDYLKSSSLIRHNKDIMYLTGMKKTLKDCLREVIEFRSTVCPQIQSRYNLHKRHHKCDRLQHTAEATINTDTQVNPSQSRITPNLDEETSCPASQVHKMCFCRRPTPCICDKNQDVNYHKIWDEIKYWIDNIPVYPNFSEDDKIKQGQMLIELTTTLKKILQKPHFHFKAKREIIKFLKELPMWHPYDSKEDTLFIEHIADILLDKMGSAAEAILEEEIAKEIENLPLDSTDNKRNDIRKVTDQFINRLKQIIADRHYGKEEYKEAIKSEITDLLENLPLRYESQNTEVKSEIADHFADRIREIKLPIRNQRTTKLQETELNNINNKVVDICKDILEIIDVKSTEKEELSQFLKDIISEYIPTDLEDIEVQHEVQNEINEWIESSTIGKRLHAKTKDKFVERILKELRTVNNDVEDTVGIVNKWIQDNIEKKVIDICKDIPELLNLKPSEKKELSEFLKNKISEYFPKDLTAIEIQQKVQKEIKEWLDDSKISQRVVVKNKDKLAERIVQELRTDFITKDDEDLIDIIEKWTQGISELIQVNELVNKEVLEDLATQLHEIQTSGEDTEYIQVEVRETVRDWLNNMLRKLKTKLNSTFQENLINELVKKINKAPRHKIYKQSEGPNIYNDVVEWIKDIPSIDSNTVINQNNAIEDLLNTLNDIINNSDKELLEEQAKNAINTFVEQLADTERLEISPKQQNILEQKLLKKMRQTTPQRKRWHKQNDFGSSTPKFYISGDLSQSPHLSFNSTPHLSPIRNVSMLEVYTEIDEYMNTINNLIDNWIKNLELSIESAEQRKLVSDVVTDIVDRYKYLQISKKPTSEAEELEHLKFQIFRRLNKLNLEELSSIISKVNDLHENLTHIRIPELTKTLNKSDLMRNFDNLKTSIKTWLENIPSDTAELHKESYSDTVFMDLAKHLAEHKDSINHYQMKNDILQWLPKLFTNLSTNTLNNLADSLKSHLVNDLAKSMAQDVTAGLMYRQMLWNTISKTLPPIHIMSSDDLHQFDLLKERLVDAFINLHYFTNNMFALDKFRTKLFNEVDKFCNEYLNRYPEPPMDSGDITKNLYNALRQVSVPNIETVKSELEQVRLKEDILDWISNLPLEASKDKEPEINAMATGLAKRLHSLEKERYNDPDKEDEIKQEIKKLIQKLPLINIDQINLQDLGDRLIEKLKSTDQSRMLNVSNVGKYDESVAPIPSTSQFPKSNYNKAALQSLECDAVRSTSYTLQYPNNKGEKSISIPKTYLHPDIDDDKVSSTRRTSQYPDIRDDEGNTIPKVLKHPNIDDDKASSIRRTSQNLNIRDDVETFIPKALQHTDSNDDQVPSIKMTYRYPELYTDEKETSIGIARQHSQIDRDRKPSFRRTSTYPDSENKSTTERAPQHLDIGDEKQTSIRRTCTGRTLQHLDVDNDKRSSIRRTSRNPDSDNKGPSTGRTLTHPDSDDDNIPSIRRTSQYPGTRYSDGKGTSIPGALQHLNVGDDKQSSIRRPSQYQESSNDKIYPIPRITRYPESVNKILTPIPKPSPYPTSSDQRTPIGRTLEYTKSSEDQLISIPTISQYEESSDDKLTSMQKDPKISEDKSIPTQSQDHQSKLHRRIQPETKKDDDKITLNRRISQIPESNDKVTLVRKADIRDDRATHVRRTSQYLGSRDDTVTPIRSSVQYPPSSLTAEDRAHLDRIRKRVGRDQKNTTTYGNATESPPRRESGIQTENNGRLEDIAQTRPSMYERGHLSPQVIIKEYYWDSTANRSMEDMTGDIRGLSPCLPCSKASQTLPQVLKINTRSIATQTDELDETYTQSKEDKICDRKICIKGTPENKTCSRPPPCYFPEERKIYQRNLPSEVIEQRSKEEEYNKCCNCGQRIYKKSRGRYKGVRQHCNLTCLKHCLNCGSGCPYPSKLYFRKEL